MKKAIFLIAIAIALIAILINEAFAIAPSGKAGVNFAQYADNSHETTLFLYDEDTNDFNLHVGKDDIYWNTTTGIATLILKRPLTITEGQRFAVDMIVPVGGFGDGWQYEDYLIEHCVGGRYYFVNAGLTINDVQYFDYADNVRIYNGGNGDGYNADATHAFTPRYDGTIANDRLDHVRFEYTATTDITISFVRVYGFTILQDNIVTGMEFDGNNLNVETWYVPFNAGWFDETNDEQTAYNNGWSNGYASGKQDVDKALYDQGYDDGSTSAQGTPIQRWGAFLLTSVTGFLAFEIYPGFPLWGLLAICISIPCLLLVLKLFVGG